ncbi:hypothetical protein HPP92_000444 [Vanilla planifolia]|uniref:Uncharacterized protein n=1 Tax=Vanilla planifolia TaxID=51239 RepID=A0A835S1B7_VANPL|nr:hypothetical protein HPP92_000444 [Vanilla planifolia]
MRPGLSLQVGIMRLLETAAELIEQSKKTQALPSVRTNPTERKRQQRKARIHVLYNQHLHASDPSIEASPALLAPFRFLDAMKPKAPAFGRQWEYYCYFEKAEEDLFRVPRVDFVQSQRKKKQGRNRVHKAMDEDLYKIPPELLYRSPKKRRLLRSLWSGCLGLDCID